MHKKRAQIKEKKGTYTMSYDMLFEKGRIGTLVLKNRGIMMPMATDLADKNGIVTPRQIRYYQERAKGGIGMIIMNIPVWTTWTAFRPSTTCVSPGITISLKWKS